MFPFNAVFVMTLLAVAMAWVPPREWLSSAVVVFVIGLVAIACQPEVEGILRGQDFSRIGAVGLLWVAITCGFAARATWRDLRNPPDAGVPRRLRRLRNRL